MTISRIYLPKKMESGDRCELRGDNRHYVIAVLRMRKGDTLLLFDGMGCEYEAVILGHDHERVNLEITGRGMTHGERIAITLAQALPKAKKMDLIIEKACELGTNTIIPFLSERSISRVSPDKAQWKQTRWQKIALEAARKSHSIGIPEIMDILPFEAMLQSSPEDAVKIISWEEETRINLKQYLRERHDVTGKDFFLVVGPEGGFTRQEIELAEKRGFTSVSLGRQILKVETAALVILSIIQYEAGVLDVTKSGDNDP